MSHMTEAEKDVLACLLLAIVSFIMGAAFGYAYAKDLF